MYLWCPLRKNHKIHTDICNRDNCEHLRSTLIDRPDCQQEQYSCDFEQEKQRGKVKGNGKGK